MQIFIQTTSHVIDVSKIAYLKTPSRGNVTIHFQDGQTASMSTIEADQLLRAMQVCDRQHRLIKTVVAA